MRAGAGPVTAEATALGQVSTEGLPAEGAAGPGAVRILRHLGGPLNLHKDQAKSKREAARPFLWPGKERPGWESGWGEAGFREL